MKKQINEPDLLGSPAGTHQEYETIFKNNRNTIKKWLKFNDWI